jgi:prolyl-tRNA synthetase
MSTIKKAVKPNVENVTKKITEIGLQAKKQEDFPSWYTQLLTKSEMLDYYDVSGCYILRPWSFNVWKVIQAFIDDAITRLGVEPAYFPLFISGKALEREKDHIEGFAPEVAWVTKAGTSDLAEPIAIRPTSETVMYPAFSKWIQSHRDLPLRLNQWCNVIRWEFKNPQPFLRTREFLWQEGHTAFLTKPEADKEVMEILDIYKAVYEDLLAVPVVAGKKSEAEKFAGGLYTCTVEAFIPTSGRAIQGATSHCLGQNFSKMFEIKVEDPVTREPTFAWQNSWGLTTRTIGVMVMVHGDDKGLILPPRVSPVQVVIVPCGIKASTPDSERERINSFCESLRDKLKAYKVKLDDRQNTPGFKFNHWELKGVPIRLEIGPSEVTKNEACVYRRDIGTKSNVSVEGISETVGKLLDTIHSDMLSKATKERDSRIRRVYEWDGLVNALTDKCLVMIPWCQEVSCEESIKKRSAITSAVVDDKAPSMGAKSLCIPFDQPEFSQEPLCVGCGKVSKEWGLFGRSY